MIDYGALRTLPELFFTQADRYDERPYLIAKRDGVWREQSWREVEARVAGFAAALDSWGLESGDRVALVAENRPEWTIADLAVMVAGGVTVPTYTTNTVENHVHVLRDSGARIAIVSTGQLARRLLPACVEAGIDTVIAMEPLAEVPDNITVHDFEAMVAQHRGAEATARARARAVEPARSDMACIIYTSGTGGAPTGVMLSHGNMICNVMGADHFLRTLPGLTEGEEVFLSFLPLSHSYEHTVGQFIPMSIGAQVYYAESLDRLVQNIAEVRPTIMTAVPRLYESIRGRVLHGAAQAGGLKEKLLHKAVAVGTRRHDGTMTLCDRLIDPVLTKLVRRKVQDRFGGRLKAFVSGGAPLNPDVGKFFIALGMRVLQGYGQTESAPVVSVNLPHNNKLDTVGPPLKGVEVRIAEDGEILVRGELVMLGYWNQPEKSAETVKDGWLHTGDVGELDDEGYLRITDRKKDIIVNSGGDNVSPQRVEGVMALAPEIGQIMVHGDKRPHLVGLVVPDAEWLGNWARENGKSSGDLAELSDDPDLHKAVAAAVERCNKDLSVTERVRRVILAEEPFSVENAMLTPSMKIRRHVIKQHYLDRLEALYGR
ncbi:long-chain fatty acid--CoA ligase [Marivibrio halodurans]|uniref:Long-chain fatty acid--CoA ligase n=1 Tax=Marivibrio halodurans TaxID=2039722 RepID=A0A8J7RYE7_9PROT|nr:long-chain fatty acid--CoA ligase [Marivibrio halodurans]MBP5856675.1 long-chain fatty acid--CoA ligase [Marivibrio halodurans]